MNNLITTLNYPSWERLKTDFLMDLFGNGIFTSGRFVFRGQACSSWPLIPSFDRIYSRPEMWDKLLQCFAESVQGYIHEDIIQDKERLSALAQHYGLPTRLLDWSHSPYVSYFFAFSEHLLLKENTTRTENIAIWALDLTSEVWNDETGVQLVNPSKEGNSRLRNQDGMFTLSKTPMVTLEEYVNQFNDRPHPALIKAIVPKTEARKALAELESMRINPSTILGEIEGCAKTP